MNGCAGCCLWSTIEHLTGQHTGEKAVQLSKSIFASITFALGLTFSGAWSKDVIQCSPGDTPSELVSICSERDEIFTLLAYAVVYRGWQEDGASNTRGHNIGSVLVDTKGNPVFWARNANTITRNGSQHGEVRLIHNFLNHSEKDRYLDDYIVYTTLEPCAMCTGMMSLTKLKRAVYGQKDPGFGDALERLAKDTTSIGGYKPYPRLFISDRSPSKYTDKLDKEFSNFGSDNITAYLRSNGAKEIFRQATEDLLNYRASNIENESVATQAVQFLKDVTKDYCSDVVACNQ